MRGRSHARIAARSPLSTWFAEAPAPAPVRRWLRAGRGALGTVPRVFPPRDAGWRSVAPGFAASLELAATGLPFQIAADRRYDRSGNARRLPRALAEGKTIFLPQIHQALPRLARLMVALRVGLFGPFREECSFLFAVHGTGRPGMGLHHDGDVDAIWLQLEGRRTVTIGPPVAPDTPEDLDDRIAAGGRRAGWRTLDLPPGTLFYLPPRTPHAVVCSGPSLAISMTWQRRRAGAAGTRARPRAAAADLARWDVVAGRVSAIPPTTPRRLWTQVPAVARADRGGLTLATPDGEIDLPRSGIRLAPHLATMSDFPRSSALAGHPALGVLLEHGILAPQDLPLSIVPEKLAALDGWRFA